MKSKQILFLGSVVALALVIAAIPFVGACAAPAPTSAPTPAPAPAPAPAAGVAETPPGVEYVVRYGSTVPLGDASNYALSCVNHILLAKTNGRMWIELYPSSQLGDEKTMMAMCREGSLPFVQLSTGKLVQVLPWASLFEYPFLFDSRDDFNTKMNDWLLETLNEDLKPFDIEVLGAMASGFHATFMRKGTRPITKMADLEGMKIRVQSPGVYLESFIAYGAKAIVMPYGEILTAMEQGVIDGYTTTPTTGTIAMGLADVTAYLSATDHMFNSQAHFVNTKWLESLPDDLRETFLECVHLAYMVTGEMFFEMKADVYAGFENRGAKTNTLPAAEKEKFKAVLGTVYDFCMEKYGKEMLDKIRITRP